jgi:hypothetical protein
MLLTESQEREKTHEPSEEAHVGDHFHERGDVSHEVRCLMWSSCDLTALIYEMFLKHSHPLGGAEPRGGQPSADTPEPFRPRNSEVGRCDRKVDERAGRMGDGQDFSGSSQHFSAPVKANLSEGSQTNLSRQVASRWPLIMSLPANETARVERAQELPGPHTTILGSSLHILRPRVPMRCLCRHISSELAPAFQAATSMSRSASSQRLRVKTFRLR